MHDADIYLVLELERIHILERHGVLGFLEISSGMGLYLVDLSIHIIPFQFIDQRTLRLLNRAIFGDLVRYCQFFNDICA